MAKITTKKSLIKKWNDKIGVVKKAYEAVRKSNPDLPGFYNSTGYKDLKKRRKRAVKRWDNRVEINEKRRDIRGVTIKLKDPSAKHFSSDVSVYESFSGVGRIFEDALIQKHNDAYLFSGIVRFKGNLFKFENYSLFRILVNEIISQLHDPKNPSPELFKWRVLREYSVFENTKSITVSYNFYYINGEENGEEN